MADREGQRHERASRSRGPRLVGDQRQNVFFPDEQVLAVVHLEFLACHSAVKAETSHVPSRVREQQQRLALARAWALGPQVVFLDEPTNGLDPPARKRMLELIRDIRDRGETFIVLSSHLLAQVEGVCDRVAILNRGQVILEGAVDELLLARNRRMAVFEDLPAEKEAALADWLRENGAGEVSIENPRTTLDQIFIEKIEAESGSKGGSP